MLVLNIFLISRYLLNSSLQSLYLLSKVTSVNNNYLKIKLKMKMHKICMKTYRFIMLEDVLFSKNCHQLLDDSLRIFFEIKKECFESFKWRVVGC